MCLRDTENVAPEYVCIYIVLAYIQSHPYPHVTWHHQLPVVSELLAPKEVTSIENIGRFLTTCPCPYSLSQLPWVG